MHDVMPKLLWLEQFIQANGYTVNHKKNPQDNKIAIMLKNVKSSCFKWNQIKKI